MFYGRQSTDGRRTVELCCAVSQSRAKIHIIFWNIENSVLDIWRIATFPQTENPLSAFQRSIMNVRRVFKVAFNLSPCLNLTDI